MLFIQRRGIQKMVDAIGVPGRSSDLLHGVTNRTARFGVAVGGDVVDFLTGEWFTSWGGTNSFTAMTGMYQSKKMEWSIHSIEYLLERFSYSHFHFTNGNALIWRSGKSHFILKEYKDGFVLEEYLTEEYGDDFKPHTTHYTTIMLYSGETAVWEH